MDQGTLNNLLLKQLQNAEDAVCTKKERIAKQVDAISPTASTSSQKDNTKIIKLVQSELNKLGCMAGYPDGILDAQTEKALFLYFKKTNQPVKLSRVPHRSFVIELQKADYAVCKKSTSNNVVKKTLSDKEIVRQVQIQLNRLNCNAGYADGIIGPKTRNALRSYSAKTGQTLIQGIYQINFFSMS